MPGKKSSTPEPTTQYLQRRERLISAFRQNRIEAFLITALPNVRYLSGFTGSNGALLLTDSRAILFTDPRYQTQAPIESDCEVRIAKGPLLLETSKSLKKLAPRRLGIERGRISFQDYDFLKSEVTGSRLVPITGVIERLRMVKSPAEIATIKTAVELNSAALRQALHSFRSRMTEIDLAAEIEYRMRRLGADGPSFDTIVASGPRSALPHAHPASTPIEGNQLLLIDMGATVAGYTSDMTRTMGVGRLVPKAKRIYKAVLESQLAAIDAVKPGVRSSSIDGTARNVLKKHGFDRFFVHSTGHGLGLEIHEIPRIGRKDPTVLDIGMVITIEPGVYVEEFGGVRIEDTVVVTEKGCQILTPTPKNLSVL
ncbi:MAG: Xaa-Pro peptidase family protein [Bryobacteraceae bacterium]